MTKRGTYEGESLIKASGLFDMLAKMLPILKRDDRRIGLVNANFSSDVHVNMNSYRDVPCKPMSYCEPAILSREDSSGLFRIISCT